MTNHVTRASAAMTTPATQTGLKLFISYFQKHKLLRDKTLVFGRQQEEPRISSDVKQPGSSWELLGSWQKDSESKPQVLVGKGRTTLNLS